MSFGEWIKQKAILALIAATEAFVVFLHVGAEAIKAARGNMDKPTLYMAGAVANKDDNGAGWRDQLKENIDDIEWKDPLDKYDADEISIMLGGGSDGVDFEEEGGETTVTDAEIVEGDKEMIDESDALLVYWEQGVAKAGTPMEVIYAYERDMPVAVVFDGLKPSPWVYYHADGLFPDFDRALDHLKMELKDNE